MADPANVTVSVQAGGDRLIEWDLDETVAWSGYQIRRTLDGEVAGEDDNLNEDIPNEADLPRREHATGGNDVWNPPLTVKNNYRDTQTVAAGDYIYSVRGVVQSGGTISQTSNWVDATAVTISSAVSSYGSFSVDGNGNLTTPPNPYKSRIAVFHLIGGSASNSQTAIDNLGINFGSMGLNFGGASGDWATYKTNEIDPFVTEDDRIGHCLSRFMGLRLVPENTASDTNTDQRAIARKNDASWAQNGMTTPLEVVEAGHDGVLLDDFQATIGGLVGADVTMIVHYGAPLGNVTHTSTALDGVELLGTILGARCNLWLDSHLGAAETDDRTGSDTITKAIVERMAGFGIRVGLEGQGLVSLSQHWLDNYSNTDVVVGFDFFFQAINAGGSVSSPLNGSNLFDSDPDASYLQPSDYSSHTWWVIIDESNSTYVDNGADASAKRARIKALALACFAFDENINVAVGSQDLVSGFSSSDWSDLLAGDAGGGVGLAANVGLSLAATESINLTLTATKEINMSLEILDNG